MNTRRLIYALTVTNIALLALSTAQLMGPAFAQSTATVLRGRALEIVDEQPLELQVVAFQRGTRWLFEINGRQQHRVGPDQRSIAQHAHGVRPVGADLRADQFDQG